MGMIDQILELFDRYGTENYGEGVTQLEHALQTAFLAQRENAGNSMIAAALLHDVGHFLADPSASAVSAGFDAQHEFVAAKWLQIAFGPAVSEPIRLHVAAKRYLCATDAAYLAGLSYASRKSLDLQGGPFQPAEAADFLANRFADDAIRLRGWDDAAKIQGFATPGLRDFVPTLQAVLKES